MDIQNTKRVLFYDEKLKLKSCLSKSQKLKFRAISIKKKFMHDEVACMLLNPIDISFSFTTTKDSIGSLMQNNYPRSEV